MVRNSWVSPCLRLSLGLGATLLAACETDVPATPPAPAALENRDQPIVNGTRDPQAVALSEGQILSLGWLFQSGDPNANFCTATLIGPSTVITAAHCTQGSRPQDVGFGVGLQPGNPDATFRVAAFFEHPQVDLTVISLSENALDRLPALVPIPVNAADPNPLEGTEVQVGGYGETRDRGRSGRYFASVMLRQVRQDEIVIDGRGVQGVCFGDSGGPVIGDLGAGPVVMGVESWGDQSCVDVDHMTRADVVIDFIQPVLDGGAPPDACNGIDYLGHCKGQVAEWCEGGQLQELDCVAEGGHCAYVDDRTGWYCVDGPPPDADPDQGVPAPTPDAAVPPDPEPDQGASGAGGQAGEGGEPGPIGGELAPPTGGTEAESLDDTDAALNDVDAGAGGAQAGEAGGNTGCSSVPARGPRAPWAAFLLLGLPLGFAFRTRSRRRARTPA